MSAFEIVFVKPWPWWVAGSAIGLFVVALAWVTGRALGVSSGYGCACGLGSGLSYWRKKPYNETWRLWFLAGLPLGGLAAAALSGALHFQPVLGALTSNPWLGASLLFTGGALIGFGARWAGGCTSGHSIVGLALGSKASLVATLGFMAAGFAVTHTLVRFLGGA